MGPAGVTSKTDKGWFHIPGVQEGTRTLEYQVRGLEALRAKAVGKTVLDLGCAEGLICEWFMNGGADFAKGFDGSIEALAIARKRYGYDDIDIEHADFNENLPCSDQRFDIILMLAILQKLKRPEKLLDFAIAHCREYIAIRIPHPIIYDSRSDYRRLSVPDYLTKRGFILEQESDGHPDDPTVWDKSKPAWLGIFRRAD